MKETAPFYNTQAWKQCRKAYTKKCGGLCERCLANGRYTAGEIVHHIKPITPKTMKDPNIALNFANLQLLCRECHAEVHGSVRRYKVDAYGRVIIKE